MKISIKTKKSIHYHLEKIKDNTFQENDIKLLLIDIREYIYTETLLKELADFIAHPTRNRGIFNKTLNARYLKLKLIDEQRQRLTPEVLENIKTERQLSDFILSGITIERVEKKLFDILFIDGLEDIGDKLFQEHYPLSKKEVKKLILESYRLDTSKKYYELKNQKDFSKIEDALKFIRGTIHSKTVFNQQTFEKEIQKAIWRIINILNLDKSYLFFVKKYSKAILLCILCLLHDAKFIFHDNHIGTCYLSLYPPSKTSISDEANKSSLVALISDDIGVVMPIFISNIKIGDYILLDETEIQAIGYMQRIPWINAGRNEKNDLVLTI